MRDMPPGGDVDADVFEDRIAGGAHAHASRRIAMPGASTGVDRRRWPAHVAARARRAAPAGQPCVRSTGYCQANLRDFLADHRQIERPVDQQQRSADFADYGSDDRAAATPTARSQEKAHGFDRRRPAAAAESWRAPTPPQRLVLWRMWRSAPWQRIARSPSSASSNSRPARRGACARAGRAR